MKRFAILFVSWAMMIASSLSARVLPAGATDSAFAGEKSTILLPDAPVSASTGAEALVSLPNAQARTLPTAVSQQATKHGPEKGHLIIIGGGEVPADIWDCFCSLAGGPEARIVVITNASGPKGAYKGPAFDEIGRRVAQVTEMHLEDIAEANDPALTAPLEEADGLFFTGGRQWRIAEVYLNTRAHAAMKALLERGGVIGGTSAGASIQGSFLWRGDTRGADILVGDHTQGLGFMKRTAIDQHLWVRGREKDLAPFIQAAPAYLGIGIDESTAVHVVQDSLWVLGRSKVALYGAGEDSFRTLEAGECCDLRQISGAGAPASAPSSVQDSASSPAELLSGEAFRWRQLIAPGVLLSAGTVGVLSPWYKENVNVPVRSFAQELSGGRRLHFDDWIQYAPVVSFVGLGFAVPSDHRFAERICITATAYAAQGILTNALKYTIREQRPDSEARNSFPSGHTATAFMGAELVRREYGPGWGAGAYAVATATALMRLYNDRHWTNDLLGGAAIGILSAEIGFWLMPLERRLFGWDGRDRALTVLPTPYGISLACVF